MGDGVFAYQILKSLWWLVPFALLIAFLRSAWSKGVFGEALVRLAAKVRLPASTYHRLHDVTLAVPDGTTQIDHVFVSCYGIFVVETKNMKGWISGGANQAQWTQRISRKSFNFQNPLRQNYKHIKALEAVLDVPAGAIHSVVAFVGSSTFKSPMPDNVTQGSTFIRHILSFRQRVLTDAEVEDALARIQSARLEQSRDTDRSHVAQLRVRADPAADRQCPECGESMVLRRALRGARAGKQFWGCSAYPRCKAVQRVS